MGLTRCYKTEVFFYIYFDYRRETSIHKVDWCKPTENKNRYPNLLNLCSDVFFWKSVLCSQLEYNAT